VFVADGSWMNTIGILYIILAFDSSDDIWMLRGESKQNSAVYIPIYMCRFIYSLFDNINSFCMLRINIFIFPLAKEEYPIILTKFRHRFHRRLLRSSYYYTHITRYKSQ